MKTKLLTLLFVLVTCAGTMHAAIANGTCGDNLTWSLNTKDSTLTIEGSGEMTGWYNESVVPWYDYRSYIVHVNISENTTTIGWHAFTNCSNLQTIDIPSTLREISNEAFKGCSKLRNITLPNEITYIGESAFADCSNLESFVFPDSVEYIEMSVLGNCSRLNHVAFGKNNKIRYSNCINALANCNNLSTVYWNAEDYGSYLSNTSPFYDNYSNYIYRWDIRGSITSLIFGNSVKKIPYNMCAGLTQIKTITIPDGAQSNSGGLSLSFANCTGLDSIHLGDSVKSINISGCNSLKYIGVVFDNPYLCSIDGVLYNKDMSRLIACPNRSDFSCTLPNTINSIANDAFSLSNVTSLTVLAKTPPGNGVNSGLTNTSCTLYVPEVSLEIYKNSLWWEDFKEIIPIPTQNPIVKFIDWDGTVLSSAEVEEGSAATAPTNPTREGYTFIGWDKDFSNVTEDLVVTAQYQINTYNVQFLDWDNAVLKEETVEWQSAATAPANPTRKGYTFIGWDKAFDNVTSDLVITAQYEFGENTNFTIVFNGNDGSELLSQEVVLKVPAAPEILGFTFIGWRPVATIIEHNVIDIVAVYTSDSATSAPEVVNPTNKAQKLIRQGNVYILSEGKTYSVQGQKVK